MITLQNDHPSKWVFFSRISWWFCWKMMIFVTDACQRALRQVHDFVLKPMDFAFKWWILQTKCDSSDTILLWTAMLALLWTSMAIPFYGWPSIRSVFNGRILISYPRILIYCWRILIYYWKLWFYNINSLTGLGVKIMNFVWKTRNCVLKTRNFVFNMMNFCRAHRHRRSYTRNSASKTFIFQGQFSTISAWGGISCSTTWFPGMCLWWIVFCTLRG